MRGGVSQQRRGVSMLSAVVGDGWAQGRCGARGRCGGVQSDRFRSVSYTHLDVYKRQIVRFSGAKG